MTWKDLIEDLNYEDREDTEKMLEISEYFLHKYSGHSENYAAELLYKFLTNHSDKYDEDYIHHDLPYRVAATIHFITHLNGSPNYLGHWMIEAGHLKSNAEAAEYFKKHFFN